MSVEVRGGKLVGGPFWAPILNKVNGWGIGEWKILME